MRVLFPVITLLKDICRHHPDHPARGENRTTAKASLLRVSNGQKLTSGISKTSRLTSNPLKLDYCLFATADSNGT